MWFYHSDFCTFVTIKLITGSFNGFMYRSSGVTTNKRTLEFRSKACSGIQGKKKRLDLSDVHAGGWTAIITPHRQETTPTIIMVGKSDPKIIKCNLTKGYPPNERM